MKKAIAIILVVFAMMVSTTSLSEDTLIDFSVYNVDQLVTIQKDLNTELQSRIIEYHTLDTIYRGVYVVGKHIKPGEYSFICTEARISSSGYYDGEVVIWNTDESGKRENIRFSAYRIGVGYGVFVALEEGMILEIGDCSGTLSACNQSWSPDK